MIVTGTDKKQFKSETNTWKLTSEKENQVNYASPKMLPLFSKITDSTTWLLFVSMAPFPVYFSISFPRAQIMEVTQEQLSVMLKSAPWERKKVQPRLWDLVAKIAFRLLYVFSLNFTVGQREKHCKNLSGSKQTQQMIHL